MIKSLKLTNFKSIGKTLIIDDDRVVEGKLDFAPLTVFCGKNSSGKSSVLQSILLLAQTLQNNVPSQTLVLNGPMVKLGDVNDIKSFFSNSKDISIEIDFTFRDSYLLINQKKVIEYIEEDINIDGFGTLKYSLSNSLDEIKEAIIIRTGFSLDLNTIVWKQNYELSDKVINTMNGHNVNYSVTEYIKEKIKHIVINKRNDDKWFYAYYYEINGLILTDEEINKLFISKKIPSSSEGRKRIIENVYLGMSFYSKDNNCISNIIPIINRIEINNKSANQPSFIGLRKNKPKNIITKDSDYEYYHLSLDNATDELIKKNININKKLIGLKLNHFLPSKFAYLLCFYKLLANASFSLIFKDFVNRDYLFDDQSVNKFNSILQEIIKNLNEHSKKKIKASQFSIPVNIKYNKELFLENVNKTIAKLKANNINKLLSDYLLTELNNQSKSPDPEIDEDISFPYKIETSELGASINNNVESINNYFLNKIIYIGPLREEPHLQYDNFIGNTTTIGTKGENCAAVLFHNNNETVRCIDSVSFYNNKIKIKQCCVKDSVNDWLNYIGVAQEVIAGYKGRYGYELKVKSNKNNEKGNDMTNVGVGVSQVLPIILACLRAPKGTTIIIEQPELHLHPAMQSKLTDFFVATMLCNKQIIIETHSEHIINRLRLRTVDCPTVKPIHEKIKIYFTEKLNDDIEDFRKGNTVFKPIEINEYAAMSDWPEGFFDESSKTADEIIKAVSKKWSENEDNE